DLSLNHTIAQKETELLLKSQEVEEVCMGLEIVKEAMGKEFVEKILPFLSHSSVKVQRSAAQALANLSDKSLSRYAAKLIEELEESSDTTVRLKCLEALGKIQDSTTVKEMILTSLHFRPNERRLAEEVISNMGLKTVPTLLNIVK